MQVFKLFFYFILDVNFILFNSRDILYLSVKEYFTTQICNVFFSIFSQMKNLLYVLTFVFLIGSSDAFASEQKSIPTVKEISLLGIDDAAYVSKVDSGFFSTVKKGYEIASKMTLDDVGKIANIVLFNNNKKVDNIINDVSAYVNQINTAQKDLRNIKINKNTKIIVKRDK